VETKLHDPTIKINDYQVIEAENNGKKIKETELKLHRVFRVLKEDVEREIAMYEKTKKKRRLKPEEEKIVRRLRKDLGLAESYLDKEISKIFKK